MAAFTAEELETLNALWRDGRVPIWAGWSAAGDAPTEIRVFRRRRYWRVFRLVKHRRTYVLYDDSERELWRGASLCALAAAIDAAPPLPD